MKLIRSSHIELYLRIAAFAVLLGRAWEHIFFNPPIHALLWNHNLTGWFIEGVLGIAWNDFLTTPGYDDVTTIFTQGIGIFYASMAILCLFSEFKSKAIQGLTLFSAFLLTVLSFMEMLDKFTTWGQLFEHSCQALAPVLLLLFLRSAILSRANLILLLKVIVALTFIAHGLYAIGFYKQPSVFVHMIRNTTGLSYATTIVLLKGIGLADIIGGLLLFYPNKRIVKIAVLHLVFWGFITAFGRTLGLLNWDQFTLSFQQSWYQTLYRLPHGFIPLALYGLIYNLAPAAIENNKWSSPFKTTLNKTYTNLN